MPGNKSFRDIVEMIARRTPARLMCGPRKAKNRVGGGIPTRLARIMYLQYCESRWGDDPTAPAEAM